MRLADRGGQIVLSERRFDSRLEIVAIRLVVGMLQLASAAFGEMAAWRLLVARTKGQRPVVEQRIPGHSERHMPSACRYSVAARGNADDELVHLVVTGRR